MEDGFYVAIKGDKVILVQIDRGNYAVMGRGAGPREFKDYRLIPIDLATVAEHAKFLEDLW